MNLIPNPARRYSVGDRTAGLKRDSDGGLTLHLQPRSPGADQEPNWLPTSAENAWFVILRMYRPHAALVEAKWECPASPESPDPPRATPFPSNHPGCATIRIPYSEPLAKSLRPWTERRL
jgi:hypothetical protein